VPEMIISILLAVGVCLLGSVLLAHGFFHDFAIFWLCFVIAGCQYSLLKVCLLPTNGMCLCPVFSQYLAVFFVLQKQVLVECLVNGKA